MLFSDVGSSPIGEFYHMETRFYYVVEFTIGRHWRTKRKTFVGRLRIGLYTFRRRLYTDKYFLLFLTILICKIKFKQIYLLNGSYTYNYKFSLFRSFLLREILSYILEKKLFAILCTIFILKYYISCFHHYAKYRQIRNRGF